MARWLFFARLLLAAVFILMPTSLLASTGITVSPAFQEVEVAASETAKSYTLKVTNNTRGTQELILSVVDFNSLDESGGLAFLGANGELDNRYSLTPWLKLEQDSIVLKAGQTKTVMVTVENKSSLAPGGHYAALLLQSKNKKLQANGPRVQFEQVISSLVLVKKIGGERYGLKLQNIDPGKGAIIPGKVELRFQNTGNVHLVPRGIVRVVDPLGRTVSKGIINEGSAFVLPESYRRMNVTMTKQGIALMPGEYKLVAEYRYDGRDEFEYQEVSLGWRQLPLILGAASLVILLFTIFIIVIRRKLWREALPVMKKLIRRLVKR